MINRYFTAFLIAGAVLAAPALGADRTWTGAAGTTDWLTPQNWTGDALPGAGDQAIVNSGTPALASSVVNVTNAWVGNGSGSDGALTIDGSAAYLAASGLFLVGSEGTGSLRILNGGGASSGNLGAVGYFPTGFGTVTIDGAGSIWDNAANLSVGTFGTGSIDILNGGTLRSYWTVIGGTNDAAGSVHLSGPGSTWASTGYIFAGESGTATIRVDNGAVLTTPNMYIATLNADANGQVIVDGQGSVLTANELRVGSSGTGSLTLSNGGVASATDFLIGENSSGNGTLTIGGMAGSPALAPGRLDASSVSFGSGTGRIVFNHNSDAYLFMPSIVGVGVIDFISGRTILSGDNSAYQGITSITDAVVSVNDRLSGALTVGQGGRLQGTGTLDDVFMTADSVVAPGNSIGTLTMANLTLSSGSLYEVELNRAGQSDRINVTGAANLDGTVRIIPYPDYRLGLPYTILTAGTINGAFAGVDEDMPFADAVLSAGPTSVLVTLMRNANSFSSYAANRNQRAVADAASALPDASAVTALLIGAPTDAAAQDALDALGGEIHADIQNMLARDQRLLRQAALNTDNADRQVVTGDGRVWARGIGTVGRSSAETGAAATDRHTVGMLAGVERNGNGWTAGIAAGQSASRIKADTVRSSAESDNTHVLIYGAADLPQDARLKLGAGYSWHEIDTRRHVASGSFDQTIRADYHGGTGQAFADIDRLYGDRLAIGPYAQIAAIYQHLGSFNESGTAGLDNNGENRSFGQSELGLRGHVTAGPSNDAVTLSGSVGWQHVIGDDGNGATNRFNDAPGTGFKVHGAPLDRDALAMGAALSMTLDQNFTFQVGYNGALSKDAQDHNFNASALLRF